MQTKGKQINELLPTYREIVQQIGFNLKSRKKILTRRIALIIWPGLFTFLLIFVFITITYSNIGKGIAPTANPWYWPAIIIIGILILFTAIYYSVMNWIFGIEKRIWIISDFEKKELSPKESWKIAKGLSMPVLKFGIKLFLRFYLPIMILAIVPIIIFHWFAISSSISNETVEIFFPFVLTICILFVVGAAIYFYYLRIKLRYIWFLFLDLYQRQDISLNYVLEVNKELNKISKSEAFKKSLILNLGTDSINIIAQAVSFNIQIGLSKFGKAAEGIGLLLRIIGEESAKQITSFSKMIGIYLLYSKVFEFLQNKPHKFNELIYSKQK